MKKLYNKIMLLSVGVLVSCAPPQSIDIKNMPGIKTVESQEANLLIDTGGNFGERVVTTVSQSFIVVKNIGTGVANNISIPDLKNDTFSLSGSGNTCRKSLEPGESCKLSVSFAPKSIGVYTGTVSVNYSNGVEVGKEAVAGLKGVGISPASLALVAMTEAQFPDTFLLGSSEKVITLTNLGEAPAVFSSRLTIDSPYSFSGGSFPGTSGTCSSVVLSGDTCNVALKFNPINIGFVQNQLVIGYNSGKSDETLNVALKGTGVSSAVLSFLNGPNYDFGSSGIGVSISKNITIKNDGGSPATLVGFSTTLSPFNYLGGSFPGSGGTCGTTLAPGSSCVLSMSFTPSSVGTASVSTKFSYNNGVGSQDVNLNLTGNGLSNAVLSISDGPIYNYGSSPVGSPLTKTFTVTNSGSVSATSVSATALASPFGFEAGSFPGSSGNCGTTIASGQSCRMTVIFNPSADGTFSNTLTLTYNNGVSSSVNTSVNLIAQSLTLGDLVVSQAPAYDFGQVVVHGLKSVTLNVSNSGGSDALNVNPSINSPFNFKGGSFPGTGGTCTSAINAGSSCTVVVDFSPTTVGVISGNLTFNYKTALVNKSTGIVLNGEGITVSSLVFLNGTQEDFGQVTVGLDKTVSLTVTNDGSFNAASLALGTVANGFSIVSTTCGTTLAASASCLIAVKFTPSAAISYIENLSVSYNDGLANQSVVTQLKGLGISGAGLTISDAPTYNFGIFPLNGQAQKVFTVSNTGLTKATAMVPAGLSSGFSFAGGSYPGTGGTCASELTSGSNCTVVVSFSDNTVGVKNSTLNLGYNNGVSATSTSTGLTATVQGRALLSFTEGSVLDFGSISINQIVSKTITVNNTGLVAANTISSSGSISA